MHLPKNIKLFLNYVVGPLLILVLAYFIYIKIDRQPHAAEAFRNILNDFNSSSVGLLFFLLGLMALNWSLEGLKWQKTLSSFQKIPFSEALKSVISGTSFGFFTPNRVGEYIGRVVVMKQGSRTQTISLTLVCSLAQLMVTLFAGILGLIVMKSFNFHFSAAQKSVGTLLFYVSLSGLLIILSLYLRLEGLAKWMETKKWLKKAHPYLIALQSLETKILWQVLILSFLRYFVFIVQYSLAFKIFKISLSPLEVFGSVSVVFLIVAIVPSLAQITELGVRWEASMELVGVFSTNMIGVFSASFTIWVINLVLPAIIGMFFLWKVRMFKGTD